MSATVKLPFARFVRRVSSGASLSKYGYIGMMQDNAAALESAPWTMATNPADQVTLTTNQLTRTDGVFDATAAKWTTPPTYTAYMDSIYDAFNQAGDAVARNATMCGYAGCVAYRFTLPTSDGDNALETVTLTLQRDRYLRAGVRISMQLSDSVTPSDDWSVIRGEASGCVRSSSTTPGEGVEGVASWGFLGQPDAPYLTASKAASGVFTADTSTAFADAADFDYLWVYITLEDMAGRWNLYTADNIRQYYIEGSAMLVSAECSFTFSNAATDTPSATSITPSSFISKATYAAVQAGTGAALGQGIVNISPVVGIAVPAINAAAQVLSVLRSGRTGGSGLPGVLDATVDLRDLCSLGFVSSSDDIKPGLYVILRQPAVSGATEISGDPLSINNVSEFYVGVMGVVVPSGKNKFSRIVLGSMIRESVLVPAGYTKVPGRGWRYDNINVGLSVWRSPSVDAFGIFQQEIMTSLAQEPGFLNASVSSVSGSLTTSIGDVTYAADMIARVDLNGLGNFNDANAPTSITIPIDPVLPGQVVYLVPNILGLSDNAAYFGSHYDTSIDQVTSQTIAGLDMGSRDHVANVNADISISFI